MASSNRWRIIGLSLLIAMLGVWGTIAVAGSAAAGLPAAVQAAPLAAVKAAPHSQEADVEPPLIGYPCGDGAQLPPWGICLHGYLLNEAGQKLDLPGLQVTVTITKGDETRTVTNITRSRPGDTAASYGIDISPLDPDYMGEVTLEIETLGKFDVIVAPNLRTQNLKFDVPVAGQTARDARQAAPTGPVWGYVVDFVANEPIADVVVTIEGPDQQVTSTQTINDGIRPWPYFTFTETQLTGIGVTPGTTFTVIAQYNGDRVARTRTRPAEDAEDKTLQVNLFTNWMCDTLEEGRQLLLEPGSESGEAPPLPPDGLPETAGADGLPDIGCFWGYVDGMNGEAKDVTVRLEVGGHAYEDKTVDFDLEQDDSRPRYGIIVRELELIEGKPLTVTAVLSGSTAVVTGTADLDAAHSQQINLELDVSREEGGLRGNRGTNSTAIVGNYVYAGTANGLIRFDSMTETGDPIRVPGGPGANPVREVTADQNGYLWLVLRGWVYRYHLATGEWREWDEEETGANVTAIGAGADGSVWFGNETGELHVFRKDGEPEWEAIPVSIQIGGINDLSVSPSGIVWVAAGPTLARYDPKAVTGWHSISLNSIVQFWEVAADQQGVWVRYGHDHSLYYAELTASAGLALFDYTISTSGLCINNYTIDYTALKVDSMWNLWLVCVSHHYSPDNPPPPTVRVLKYDPPTGNWTTVIEVSGDDYHSISIDEASQSIWLGTLDGVSQYAIASGTQLKQFVWVGLYRGVFDAGRINDVEATSDTLFAIVSDNNDQESVSLSYYDADTLEFKETLGEWVLDTTGINIPLALNPDDGTLWIGLPGTGASHYMPGAAEPWVDYVATGDSATGLITDTVYAIATHQGSTWFATSAGVSVVTPDSQPEWRAYQDEILQTSQFPEGSMVADSAGNIWLNNGGKLLIYVRDNDAWHACDTEVVIDIDLDPKDNKVWALTRKEPDLTGTKLIKLFPNSEDCKNKNGTELTEIDVELQDVDSVAFDHNGDIWIGAGDRCAFYDIQIATWFELSYDNDSTCRLLDANTNRDGIVASDFNTLSLWTAPAKQPDLNLTLQAPDEWASGSEEPVYLAYTLTIANDGPRPATDTTLTLDLPDGVTFSTASCEDLDEGQECPQPKTDPPTWALGEFAPEETFTIVVTTTVNPNLAPIGATLEATASATTTAAEAYTANNATEPAATLVTDARPDARVTLSGPEQFAPDEATTLTVRADNVGGSPATARVTVALGPHLSTTDELSWDNVELPPDPDDNESESFERTITVQVAADAPPDARLTATATVTADAEEQTLHNNTSTTIIPTTLQSVRTLILYAEARMEQKYGASTVLDDVYRLASHPAVNGVVVDVMDDPIVLAAYESWDDARGDPDEDENQAADDVADAISALVQSKTAAQPQIAYVVIIGADHIIPFHRVQDRSATRWRESDYAKAFLTSSAASADAPPGGTTVYEALRADYLLTDDCYTDRQPTPVDSPAWTSNAGLCQPDLPTGRLVETPEEIGAAIDAFILVGGAVQIDSAIVGSTAGANDQESLGNDAGLTADLDDDQCRALRQSRLAPLCRRSNKTLRDSLLAAPYRLILASQHSTHYSIGSFRSSDIQASTVDYIGKVLATIGCHAGLSVPPRVDSESIDWDMAQAWSGRGGTFIGSAAYGYGSKAGIGYSEFFLQALTKELARGGSVEVGPAMLRAKQIYVARHMGGGDAATGFTHLDEKIVLPVTLYGLPMLRVVTPGPAVEAVPPAIGYRLAASTIISPLVLVDPDLFNPNPTTEGMFYDYAGEVFEREGMPVQPAHDVAVPVAKEGRTARGALMQSATFTVTAPFIPYRGQPWALSAASYESQPQQAGPQIYLPVAAGAPPDVSWDHALPFTFGFFESGGESSAYVFTVLGAYNETTGEERRYNHLALEVIYSDASDAQPPTIIQSESFATYGQLRLTARADDASGISRVVALCEYGGAGRIESVELKWNKIRWIGGCPEAEGVTRTMVQVVDNAGNVAAGAWQTSPSTTLTGPDLVVESVVATPEGVAIVIRNVGTTAVPANLGFWVDVYLDPDPPPVAEEDIWGDGRSFFGAAWRIYPSIPPGGRLTLLTSDGSPDPEHTNLPDVLPLGAKVYAQVDSWNDGTEYGFVEEMHELGGGPYNNILGPVEIQAGDLPGSNSGAPLLEIPSSGSPSKRPEPEVKNE